jgi:hypothetical protein
MIDIITQANNLGYAVKNFVSHAKSYYYQVMLSGFQCPGCHGSLVMTGQSWCRCLDCQYEFDPTVAFQKCSCGAEVKLKICRYQCRRCGQIIQSRFTFMGNVFNRDYFREKMQQSREKNEKARQQVIESALESRSEPLQADYIDLSLVDGLEDALDRLSIIPELSGFIPLCSGFDLNRYQQHLDACITGNDICFDDLPALEEDARLDRIWRFVTVIFMEHTGTIQLYQENGTIFINRIK